MFYDTQLSKNIRQRFITFTLNQLDALVSPMESSRFYLHHRRGLVLNQQRSASMHDHLHALSRTEGNQPFNFHWVTRGQL